MYSSSTTDEIVKYAKCMAIGEIEDYSRGHFADAYGRLKDLYIWAEYYSYDDTWDTALTMVAIHIKKHEKDGWHLLVCMDLDSPIQILPLVN
jgi:hypothetical protein